jgi:hypothetical protein
VRWFSENAKCMVECICTQRIGHEVTTAAACGYYVLIRKLRCVNSCHSIPLENKVTPYTGARGSVVG